DGGWRLAAVALVIVGATSAGVAQRSPRPFDQGSERAEQGRGAQRTQGTVQAHVTAVLVDVVIHDRKGEPVRDLRQSEFQIAEDGVAQTIASFTPVMEGTVASAAAAPPASGTAMPSTATVGADAPVDAGPTVTAV